MFRVDDHAAGNSFSTGVLEEAEGGEKSASLVLGDAGVLNDTKVLAAISLEDDHITLDDRESGVPEQVEDTDA